MTKPQPCALDFRSQKVDIIMTRMKTCAAQGWPCLQGREEQMVRRCGQAMLILHFSPVIVQDFVNFNFQVCEFHVYTAFFKIGVPTK